MKLYTIGYDGMNLVEMLRVLKALKIGSVIDTRSVAVGWRPGFHGKTLRIALEESGISYSWQGACLGGRRAGPTWAGLRMLVSNFHEALSLTKRIGQPEQSSCALLCKEEAPWNCHRHHAIAVPLLRENVDCVHIYQHQLIQASSLEDVLAIERSTGRQEVPYKFETWE